MLFEHILRIKLKACENKNDLNIFLNGSTFTRNGIIIPLLLTKATFFTRRYVFHLTRYEHKGVSKSIGFDDTTFSSVGLAE